MAIRTFPLALASGLLLSMALTVTAHAESARGGPAQANEKLVRQAFERWRLGQGSVFDLLHDDVRWTVAGNSPVSGVYRSKKDLMNTAVAPITARLSTPIVPQVQQVHAQGDAVIVVWQGRATAKDGSAYDNSYAWHMRMQDGKIVDVLAFLDTWRLAQLLD
ncbi:Ketosteroid isomerase-related protein [Bordetella ansorpii]|uniref:Ketosteroid isomerase-related protein n=1 Tax=Bordetella ansorpii TaxID=288768 RepID=A0A157SWE8_9BORD|nr:nuclear transport factor 2 family protein [Bordetella ansorpii]SAI74792.1 Ketosteroid isomerase-related protein [Bordetella ansorpii]